MPNVSTTNLLNNPQLLSRIVQREYAPSSATLTFFNMMPGGSNTRPFLGRSFPYDIFNDVRTAATVRAPGASASRIKPQSVSQVSATIARTFEMMSLDAERVYNYRGIGMNAGSAPEPNDYITKQSKVPAQRKATWRTVLLYGMLRDSLYYTQNGDDHYLTFASVNGTSRRINHQMPAGNKDQLNMLGTGDIIGTSWDNTNAPIFEDLGQINAAMQANVGVALRYIMCDYEMWGYVTNNTGLRNRAGSSNQIFSTFTHEVGTDSFGKPINQFRGKIASVPWIDWIITDEGASLGAPGSETYTKFIEQNKAIFLPEPSNLIFELVEGTEPVCEYDGGTMTPRTGSYDWIKPVSNPTGWELYSLDNALVVNYIPKAVAYGTPVFSTA